MLSYADNLLALLDSPRALERVRTDLRQRYDVRCRKDNLPKLLEPAHKYIQPSPIPTRNFQQPLAYIRSFS